MLYLIGGENQFQSLQRLQELKEDFKKRYDGQIIIVNADEVDSVADLTKDTESLSLFTKEKLVIIKRLFSCRAIIIDAFSNYLKSSGNVKYILWEDSSFDKRRSIYKYFQKKGVVEEFSYLKHTQLKTWLSKYFKDRMACDPQCIESLIVKIGEDQMQLASAVDTLVTLAKSEDQKYVYAEDIDRLIKKTAEESMWDFIDAIGESDRIKALTIMEDLYRERQDFVLIIAMLAREFRILAQVSSLLQKGKNYSEIVSVLKLHPFVVRKAITHSKNFAYEILAKLFSKLLKTDLAVKKGRFNEKLALSLLVAAI
jgi:DNA polymerase-3 subunit delta